MTHVVRAQARAVATTKIAAAGLLAMAAFVVLTGLTPAVLFGQHRDPHTVLEGAATIAAVTAMLLGALQTAGDLQNGMSRALLPAGEPGLGAGVGAAASLHGLLGAAAGVVLRNAALAAYVIVLWSYALEPFISTLSYRVYISTFPGGAPESPVRHVSAHHHIPPPLAGGLTLAGWASAAALAAVLMFHPTRHRLARPTWDPAMAVRGRP